jgi:hypothetical protein
MCKRKRKKKYTKTVDCCCLMRVYYINFTNSLTCAPSLHAVSLRDRLQMGNTALTSAAVHGHLEAVRMLVAANADIQFVDRVCHY